jgi:uncharacterized protein
MIDGPIDGPGTYSVYPSLYIEKVVKFFRRSAEEGNVAHQYMLGGLYFDGVQGSDGLPGSPKGGVQGSVPQDYAEAMKWYRLAAEQGHTKAQFTLALMHLHGQGVPVNYPEAYKWFLLVTAQGSKPSADPSDLIAKYLTDEQISEARRLAADLWEDYQSRQ